MSPHKNNIVLSLLKACGMIIKRYDQTLLNLIKVQKQALKKKFSVNAKLDM